MDFFLSLVALSFFYLIFFIFKFILIIYFYFISLILILIFKFSFSFFLPFLLSRVADRVLVLWPGVRPELPRWESQVQDVGHQKTPSPT